MDNIADEITGAFVFALLLLLLNQLGSQLSSSQIAQQALENGKEAAEILLGGEGIIGIVEKAVAIFVSLVVGLPKLLEILDF